MKSMKQTWLGHGLLQQSDMFGDVTDGRLKATPEDDTH